MDRSMKGPHELLSMETALLIATASSREIDVSSWFGEKSNDGKLPVREFDAKLVSLASTMGINQDQETKRELELATSALAVRMVHTICDAGRDEFDQLLIDVSYFFRLCQEKVDRYLSEIDEQGEFTGGGDDDVVAPTHVGDDFRRWSEGEYDIHGNPIKVSPVTDHDEPVVVPDKSSLIVEKYIMDIKEKAAEPRPKSAPAGGRSMSRSETVEQLLISTYDKVDSSPTKAMIKVTNDMQWSEAKMTSSSPYDEEIEFPDEEHLDFEVDTMEITRYRKVESCKEKKHDIMAQDSGQIDWNAENRAFLQLTSNMPSKNEIPNKARPNSAPRLRRSEDNLVATPAIRSRSAERVRTQQNNPTLKRSDSPTRRNSFSAETMNGKSRSVNKLPLTEERLEKLKDMVEELVRDAVKKTDCYHLIQVNLGYIERYTMVPPRGAIVQSKYREWITNREIHGAFISGRLCLNDNQIKALKHLVADFMKHYKNLYKEKADKMLKLNEELEEKLPGPVFGPNHTLSSEWLKKYLIHLRLTKRQTPVENVVAQSKALNTSSIGSKSATFDPTDSTTKASEEEKEKIDAHKTPICWKEWLGKKLKQEMERGPVKPKDLQKALNGQNHPLSKEDIEFLLKTHHILPQEALQQEIEYRIESWVLDTDGRRDFQHQLNVKIRTWIWDEMILTKAAKLPKNEQGYWRVWQSLPKERRSAVKEAIIKKLVDEKREELKSSERSKNEITKQLYWQFDAARKERETLWSEWLSSHFDKFRRNLDKFKKDEEERLKIANKQKQRRKSMASLQAIEKSLKEYGQSLDSHHQMQLQKGIVSLRRAAQENGLGKGGIITKEEFDAHIKKILAPYIPLDETFIETHAMSKDAEPTSSNIAATESWRRRIANLFTPDPKETIERVHKDQNEQTNRSKESYHVWLMEKKKAIQEQEKKQVIKFSCIYFMIITKICTLDGTKRKRRI
jgi:hypothetical protein